MVPRISVHGVWLCASAVALAVSGGCGSDARGTSDGGSRDARDAGSVESVIQLCEQLEASAATCSEACDAASETARAVCAAHRDRTRADPGFAAFQTCTGACPVARQCTSGSITRVFYDCDCAGACLAERSSSFQEDYRETASCEAAELRGACF